MVGVHGLGAGGSVASDAASNGTEKRVAGREVTDTATARRVADFEVGVDCRLGRSDNCQVPHPAVVSS